MNRKQMVVRAVLIVTVSTLFLDAPGALAAHAPTIHDPVVGHGDVMPSEEALLNFRVEEVVDRHSPSGCVADPKMVREERHLDPQLSASDKRNDFAPLKPDGCTKIKDTKPTKR